MTARPLLSNLVLALACAQPAMAQTSDLAVSVQRVDIDNQHVFEVAASGTVRASQAQVWKILTDYERMPEFVPDLQTAKVLSRTGQQAVVEQFGVARFLFIRRDIRLVVQVNEQPMSAIDIGLVSGDMKVYNCRWSMTPVPETGGTRITYSGKLVPRFYVPGILAANIIRGDIEKMMKAVLERLDQQE
ncbi:cyclase/dehydrase [Massilia glaciei]|uniref:Cyclase/dehydrase n=2 Tax=Massilia glaciei TaxID=1524097 RepID=A0A2U2I5X9_9BURK|nr:cyclase/dehydrase [Massilia glaciei]